VAAIDKRVGKKGTTWRVRVAVKGCPPQIMSFRRRTDAALWAAKTEAALRDGLAVPGRRERQRTVAELTAHYRKIALPAYAPAEQRKRRAHLDWWDGQLGGRRLIDLKAPDFSQALRQLAAGESLSGAAVGPATQVRYLATIRHAFSLAVKDWGWLEHNPAAHVRTPKEPRGRDRYLMPDEISRLLACCRSSSDERLYPLAALALLTGAREGELLRLRWQDVGLGRRTAVLPRTKNGESRTLQLPNRAVEVLRETARLRRLGSDEIFADKRLVARFPTREWRQAVAAAGLSDFHFHDLRHTFASHLAMSGATLLELAAALGHKTLAMVKRYAHLCEQHTAAVVSRMADTLPV
jgi:integrase